MAKLKVLAGCVACLFCNNHTDPSAIGVLRPKDLTLLNYCGCQVDKKNYLINASRKCLKKKGD